jgi:peptidoglycan/xylan/chitin deacetylase (PgdA/CDA1 family)
MASLVVTHPPGREQERHYACDVVLRDWLGLDWRAEVAEVPDYRITAADDPRGRALHLPDVFFPRAAAAWLMPASLPTGPIESWPAGQARSPLNGAVPVLFGEPDRAQDGHELRDGQIRLPIDVFGSIFFLLSRYEEVVSEARDRHDRFAGTGSFSHRFGLLERPLANEYLEIFWTGLQRLWPALERRRRTYRVDLSCDADVPFSAIGRSWQRLGLSLGADLVKRRAPDLALRRLRAKFAGGVAGIQLDPNNTFDFMMKTGEKHGLKTTFFLKAGVSEPLVDEEYCLESPPVAPVLREIYARGHELGLHPSYHTYRDGARLKAEFATLLRAAERLRLHQPAWGGRQHYLRFAVPETWRHYASAGLFYDATLAHADQPGFRCGTCYDFPVYDLEQGGPLPLRERPLTVMEMTLLNWEYLGLSTEQAHERIARLAAVCRRFAGTFSLLWHNNVLITGEQQRLYDAIVTEIAK